VRAPRCWAGLCPTDCVLQDLKIGEEVIDSGGQGLPPSIAEPDDLAAILYTSGSTGRPKGVMLSHANLWLGAESVASYLKLAPEDRVLGVLPLSFDYGQNQLLSSWYAGAAVAPLDYLTARDVVKAVARHGRRRSRVFPRSGCNLSRPNGPPKPLRI
jgi:long-subunit acyl-CoA synthetase (AMP-forming)